jgi:ankyrin repeat protein
LEHAPKLAELLIKRRVNLNLVDKDGKSPLLVSIKKSQIEAIEYAHQHNIKRRQEMSKEKAYMGSSSMIRKSIHKLELFDFEVRGRNVVSPLHYVIKKSNYEAFVYLIQHHMCDCL